MEVFSLRAKSTDEVYTLLFSGVITEKMWYVGFIF